MTLPIAHIFNGELGFDVRTKLNDLIDLAGGGSAPFTPGSVPFADASGFFIQDNANFFWDDPNNLLTSGVGLKIKGATSGVVTVNTKAAAGTWTLTLPDTAGTSGYALTTNGSGVTSWTSAGGGGSMAIGGAVTGGTSRSVLFINPAGVLAQDNAHLSFDPSTYHFSVGSTGTNGSYDLNGLPGLYMVPNASGNNWFEGQAGNVSVTGNRNFATGAGSMVNLTTGSDNLGMGFNALYSMSTGSNNMAVGDSALLSNFSGSNNVAVGTFALSTATGDSNVAIGTRAMIFLPVGNNNVAIGYNCFQYLGNGGASDNNVGLGRAAAGFLQSGTENIFIGQSAGEGLPSGNDNIFIGHGVALNLSATSHRNTIIGAAWFGPGGSINNTIILSDGSSNSSSLLANALDCNFTNANTWTFQKGTSPLGLHVYNTTDKGAPPTNYERAILDWNATANVLTIGTQAGGTGVKRLTAIDGFAKAGAPASGDLPASSFAVIDDTSGGATWLVFNKAGTIRKVQLV